MAGTEPWVGTWRPHKPRGPIAALCGSPGPKYMLPRLLGNSNHDPTRYKAPEYSFGKRHEEDYNDSPGPRYLVPPNITRMGPDGTPAFSLSSRPRAPELFLAPGPGQYSPEHSGKLTFQASPAYSFSRRFEDAGNNTPGPASYTLPPVHGHKAMAKPSAPSYSFSGRNKMGTFYEDLKRTPGPAAYKSVDPRVHRKTAPCYSMTGRCAATRDPTTKPGPGAHYPERVILTRAKAPSFSFGVRHSEYICPVIVDDFE